MTSTTSTTGRYAFLILVVPVILMILLYMNAEILALSIVILLFSVIVHEVMHGLVALRFGDRTAENAGRLTLNPIPHIDPIGTILLPALFIFLPMLTGVHAGFFIGWAKPVPVNPLNFSDIRRGELLVSLAGVGSNFALAVIGAILYHMFAQNPFLAEIFQFTVSINLTLAVFNLLPIPPLDGSKALLALLPYHLARSYERFSEYGFIVIIALMYFNILSLILGAIVTPLALLLGMPAY